MITLKKCMNSEAIAVGVGILTVQKVQHAYNHHEIIPMAWG
jgi:hypothetical protein